jgi:uncharacterized repeat protein (TIGR04042 family)
MHFRVHWPNGDAVETCYSPSLVIKDYFSPGETYALADVVQRSRTALTIASDRVLATYSHACSRAKAQLASIDSVARTFAARQYRYARVAEAFLDEFRT